MERLPFFVYGTLIPDQPNYYLWKDSITNTKEGIIKNYLLFDMGHYPMIVQSEGNNVHGMLMYVNEDYERITKIIDNLEGYNPENHGSSAYNREMRDIELKNGELEKAWIYIGSKEYVKEENSVKDGNWIKHISKKEGSNDWWRNVNTVKGLNEK